MKVLIVVYNFDIGGAHRQLIYLMRGLLDRGITLSLLILDPVGEFMDEIPDKVNVYYPKSPKPRGLLKPLRGMWRINEAIRVVHKEKPDVLYSRSWYAKVATALAGQLLRKKVVLSEVDSLISMSYKNVGRTTFYSRNIACHLADVIVPVSQGIAHELEQLFRLSPRKIRVIYNGLDIEEIERKSREEVSHPWLYEEEPIAVAVGRLVNQKGFSYLLEAVELVNRKIPLQLMIIGDGVLREELKKKAEGLGIEDKVDFLGIKKNPFAYMKRCSLFVLSSLHEGLPNVLIEAMALGLPVISTRCPTGPSEIIEDGRSGILVPVGDPHAIAEAILRVLGDAQLRHTLSVEAKRRARDFSLENMISKYSELFLSLSGRI
jgi:glycosyltransferase involved in cell wall biosynthesis